MQLIHVNKHRFKSKLYNQLTDFNNIYYNKQIIIKLYARHDDYLTDFTVSCDLSNTCRPRLVCV